MSFVEPADIAARLGRALTDSETVQVEAWIGDLDAIVQARIPGLADQLASGALPPGLVRTVYAQAIRRVLLNPEGLRQSSETIDDYTTSKTYDAAVSGSALYLTDDEWAMLSPAAASSAYSIRPHGSHDRRGPDLWDGLSLTWYLSP